MKKFRKAGQHTQVKFDPAEVVQWRAFLLILAAEATQALETISAKLAAGSVSTAEEGLQYWRTALRVLTWIDSRVDKGIRADALEFALKQVIGLDAEPHPPRV